MSKIIYATKIDTVSNPSPEVNKITASNMNEIKTSVNAAYDLIDAIPAPLTASEIRDELETLAGVNRLSATAVKDIPLYDLDGDNFYVESSEVRIKGGNIAQDTTAGITLTFKRNTMYGTPSIPLSGAIEESFTAANIGAEAILWYDDSSLPLDAKYKLILGTYAPNVLNQIILRYFSDTYITYQVFQEI